jgi:hypothetical protein
MTKHSDETTKKAKNIEVEPKRMILLLKLKPAPQIAVIDRKLQETFPSLLVSSTQTVRKEQIELLRDSEPKIQHDK